MKSGPNSAHLELSNARQAIKQGDRLAARRWAEAAASLRPELEEPWLILAAVASPRASVAYLEQALRINPQSERARKGMHWAAARLRTDGGLRKSSIIPAQNPGLVRISELGSIVGSTKKNLVIRGIPPSVSHTAPENSLSISGSQVKYRWSFLTLIVLALCVTAGWAFWPGNTSSVLAILQLPRAMHPGLSAQIEVEKPTYTPTFTPTYTPTNTFTPTPTSTSTPTPTATNTPSPTPLPTDTPRPLPTDTPYSYPDYGGERWIDVDLSQQVVYAYEGDYIVASFLVSTGVPAYPTVTGQFHIYIKLVSTLMYGDGYYLPDVPYTMYFYKGYGLHGTYWHSNFGHPMSHGCVNMYTPDAEWLFYWASEGTLVNIHY